MALPLGIVTGLVHEAAIIRREPGSHRVACHGPGPDRATAAAEELVRQGIGALCSFGVAGGLSSKADTGTLLVPSTVIDAASGAILACDGLRRKAVLSDLVRLAPGSQILDTAIVTVIEPALTVTLKHDLHRQFAADAVDMESASIARVAADRGLPFFALRVVLDGGDMAIPPSAMVGMRPDGRTNAMATIAMLARNPGDLPALIALGGADRRARRALAGLAHLALGAIDAVEQRNL